MNTQNFQQDFICQLSVSSQADRFLNRLDHCGNLNPTQQLAIYKNNHISILLKTLTEIYPVCNKILGDNYFKQLAKKYIINHPSKQFDLNDYGENFPIFMQAYYRQHDELQDFPYLRDLAKLEWFYHQVYYADDSPTFDFELFALLTERQQSVIQFELASAFKFMASDYPIISIWQLNNDASIQSIRLVNKAEYCAIFRTNNRAEINLIDKNTYDLLNLILNKATLSELADFENNNNLSRLIQSGWISHFTMNHV